MTLANPQPIREMANAGRIERALGNFTQRTRHGGR
jgi:hypothetical protein